MPFFGKFHYFSCPFIKSVRLQFAVLQSANAMAVRLNLSPVTSLKTVKYVGTKGEMRITFYIPSYVITVPTSLRDILKMFSPLAFTHKL
jgi:hypothetical protein